MIWIWYDTTRNKKKVLDPAKKKVRLFLLSIIMFPFHKCSHFTHNHVVTHPPAQPTHPPHPHLDVNIAGGWQRRVVQRAEKHVDAHALGLELDHLRRIDGLTDCGRMENDNDWLVYWLVGRLVQWLIDSGRNECCGEPATKQRGLLLYIICIRYCCTKKGTKKGTKQGNKKKWK